MSSTAVKSAAVTREQAAPARERTLIRPPGRWPGLGLGMASAVTLFVTGYLFFRKREPTFSDVV